MFRVIYIRRTEVVQNVLSAYRFYNTLHFYLSIAILLLLNSPVLTEPDLPMFLLAIR